MKNILETIKKFINSTFTITNIWNIVRSRTFAYVIIGIFAFTAFKTCKSNKDLVAEKTKIEQNLVAANDTAKYYKNKNGELVTEKTTLILSVKELKKENKDLYDKVKEQKGSIISLNTVVLNLKQDTSILRNKLRQLSTPEPSKVNDSTWIVPWNLEYKWDEKNYDNYVGRTTVGIKGEVPLNSISILNKGSELVERTSNIDLTFGEKVVDGKYNVYVTTKYPGLTAKSLEGVFIDPNTNKDIKKLIKKQHWFTGFSVGIGVTPGFDITTGKYGLCVGPTLTYNIFEW